MESDNNSNVNTRNEDMFDYESKSFDFKYLTSTKLPFNKRVFMPPSADIAVESKMMYAREEINKIMETYRKDRKEV